MDLKKLTTADRVVAGAAIVFLIAFFLPWEGKTVSFGTVSASKSWSGSEYFLTGWIPLLLAIAMVVQIGLARFSTTQLPKLPVTWGQAHLIAGSVAAVLVILRLLFTANVSGVDLDRKVGLFIAVLAAIGLGVGGFLKSKEPEEAYNTGPVPGGYPGSPPPPPPPGGGSF
jgi:hypothetical protein